MTPRIPPAQKKTKAGAKATAKKPTSQAAPLGAKARRAPGTPAAAKRKDRRRAIVLAKQPVRLTTTEGAPVPRALLVGRLSPEAFKAEIWRRGWTLRTASMRWGIGENWLTKLAGNADRALHWDDAVRGLPMLDG